jgi:phage replication O-like protein O
MNQLNDNKPNPQKENGHTQIANELLEALLRARLNGTQWDIIMCVIRKTYGFNKKEDWISLTQFQTATKKDRTTICKAIKALVAKQLLVVKKLPGKTIYGLNKGYSGWVVVKPPLVVKTHTASGENAQKVVVKPPLTKDSITKDIIQKTLPKGNKPLAYGNAEINNMLLALKGKIQIDSFADSQKWERIYAKHCYTLLEKIGSTEFARRLDIILEDDFKHKNCNKIKYVYEQVKGFIEPTQSIKSF